MAMKKIALGAWVLCAGVSVSGAAQAQAPAPAAPEEPKPNAMTVPAMAGPLVANPNPASWDTPLGTLYATGAVSAFSMWQTRPAASDRDQRLDFTNGQVVVQKTEGLVQFYVHAGAYSFPSLGTPYLTAERATGDFFSPVPVAYVKLAPTDEFSIQAGKLYTLIGAEYAFTYQNMNIERGLLWNQEPIVSRGVQANYTLGPVAFSASLNDGYYSDSYNWLTGSAAWTINKENTLSVVGGGNFDQTSKNVFPKTPFFQNNGEIFNLIYTYNAAPFTITPYFQYTHVPKNPGLGALTGASTYGGAVLANYALSENINFASRFEYISSTGNIFAPNLLYGPGSNAWSVTFTPTYSLGQFFVRAEGSVVQADNITPGLAFGKGGNGRTQGRFMVETGVVF
jgi:hypothetical protein